VLLFLQRESGDSKATLGKLYIDGEYFCHTLEPKYVNPGVKINGQTAIPASSYIIILNDSAHFNRELPLLLGVNNFTSIRIHAGNRAVDTQGCPLVGFQRGDDGDGPVIWESRKAESELMAKLKQAENKELLCITIKDA
jgi:hypothetical protein